MSPTKESTCDRIEPLLDDLVDGQLSAAEGRRVREHLAGCAACSAELAALEGLLAATAELPREVAPAEDLWPRLAPRLAPRQTPRLAAWPGWLRQAAAAVLFMALGGVLSQLLSPGAEAPEPFTAARPASLDRQADFALAEADYLRAKEALWAAVYHGRDAVSPDTREVVERNLRVIDEAIRELRQALAVDPGNQQLENLLLAQHRNEIDLLQRLRRATAET